MSQCVPGWDLIDRSAVHERPSLRSRSSSTAPDVPLLDYEVAELTWENGQVAMHGFGVPRPAMKPVSSTVQAKYAWEKPRASGTLESIVNQATHALPRSRASFNGGGKNDDLVPWFDHHRSGSATIAMDALVPCSNRAEGPLTHVIDISLAGGSIDRVGSCSVAGAKEEAVFVPFKRAKAARVPSPSDWSSRDLSVTSSDTIEKESQRFSLDTFDDDFGAGFTSNSPENTISGRLCSKSTTVDDHNSFCHSQPQRFAGDDDDKKKRNGKSSLSIKRSRAAAVHNQSERKRRDKINQRMKTLQKLVPNSSKTDKASMLDEVIEYLKQLQAQVQMMRMHAPAMMLPLPAMTAMQQQLQISMLQASMGLGPMIGAMGMGMGLDMNSIGRANISAVPPAAPFMFVNPWDSSGDRLQASSSGILPDPLSAFIPCQSPPINMEAYCRLAAMYQQLQQPPMSCSKN